MSMGQKKLSIDAKWRSLSEVYHAHHSQCAVCKAAGLGKEYGKRCSTGAPMWAAYQSA